MALGEDLKVRISAATRSFESSMEDAQDSLNSVRDTSASTAVSLQTLQGRANEAGDEIGRTERKADSASRSLGALTASTTSLSVAFGALSTVSTLSLVPALGALSTTLVPLTATVGGLATALAGVATGMGAVVGSGLFAYGNQLAEQNKERLQQLKTKKERLLGVKEETGKLTEAQQEQLETLENQIEQTEESTSVMGALSEELKPVKEQFHESAMAIGEEFVPLIKDAIDALPELIRRIEDSLGSLQPFADALRDAGKAAMDTIPRVVSQMMDMGRKALPAVRDLGRYLNRNIIPIMKGMADTTSEVIRILPNIGENAVKVIPKLNKFGLKILKTVVPAATKLGDIVVDVVNGFNDLSKNMQNAIKKGTLLAPAILGISAKLAAINPVLGGVTAAVGALGIAWSENIGSIRTKTNKFIRDVTGFEDVQKLLSETAKKAATELGKMVNDFDDFISTNETAQETIKDLKSGLNNASDSIESLADGQWSRGFDKLSDSVSDTISAIETMLIGEGGGGGLVAIVDDSITEAQRWLKSEGTGIIKEAYRNLFDNVVDVASSLQNVLIGPEGKSGALSEMVDQADTFLTETAPVLLKAAMKEVGRAIREGLIDFTNPLRGKDSEIWDMLTDSVTWLVENIPKIMGAVGEAIIDGITAAATGLFEGLVGESAQSIPNQIEQAAWWLTTKMGDLIGKKQRDVGGAIADAIIDGIAGLGDRVKEKINDAIAFVNDALPSELNIPEIKVGGGSINIPSETVGAGPASRLPGFPLTVGGGSIDIPEASVGGQTIDLPQLNTGGFIEESGMLLAHAGEQIVPESQVSSRGEVESSLDSETIAEGVARGFRRANTNNEGPQEITITLEDQDRYRTVRR